MSKYLPTILPVVTTAAIAVAPQVQAGLGRHPIISAVVAAAYAILAHWLPSPARA
jgi:hypothetical protein